MATFLEDEFQVAGTGANTVLTKPAGTADGHIMIAVLSNENNVAITPPTDWRLLQNQDHLAQVHDIHVYWKRAGASEPSSYTWTHASTWRTGYIVTVQDVSATANPKISAPNQAASTTGTAFALTTDGNDAFVMFASATFDDRSIASPPSGSTPTFTTRWNSGNNLYIATGTWSSAGDTGNKSITYPTSANWLCNLIVVEDVATSGTPVVHHTAVGAKSAGGTTTVSVPHPMNTGPDQMLVAGRCTWHTLAVNDPIDETGWTARSKTNGGTGSTADAHTSTIRADIKALTAAEAGPTVFDQSGTQGTNAGAIGVMASYTKTDSNAAWETATTSGTDNTHGTNRSVTGTATIAFQPGDILVAFASVDTDTALTITSPALTASGITFGPTNRHTSGIGVTTGLDGNIELFDAVVTSGTGTVAPTLAFTTATSQCGPVSFVRLRAATSAITLQPPAIDSTTTVDAPTITVGAVTVEPPALGPTATLAAPSLYVQIFLPAVDSTTTLNAPTVTAGAVTITAPAIASTTVVRVPTVTVGAVTVSLPTISATVVHTPSVAAIIYAPAIAATTVVRVPTITTGAVTVTAPAIASTTSLHAPTVQVAPSFLNLPAIAATTVVRTQTVTVGAVAVSPPAIASTTTLFGQRLALNIQAPAIAAGTVVRIPTITVGAVTITAPAIASTTALHAPSVFAGVTLMPPSITGTVLHAPTITTGAITISAPAIAATTILRTPALSLRISLAHIAATTALHAPRVAGSVLPPAIASTTTLHTPTMVPGAIAVAPPAITTTAVVNGPTVTVGAVTITLPVITGTVVHTPAVIGAGTVGTPQLGPTSTLFTPTITPGAIAITAAHITSATLLYVPTVQNAPQFLLLPLISAASLLHSPQILALRTGMQFVEWNGSTLVTLTPHEWDGTQLVPLTLKEMS